jgi:hypothetical protein
VVDQPDDHKQECGSEGYDHGIHYSGDCPTPRPGEHQSRLTDCITHSKLRPIALSWKFRRRTAFTALTQKLRGFIAVLAAYLTYWLENVAVHQPRETTHTLYTAVVAQYLIPGLGRKPPSNGSLASPLVQIQVIDGDFIQRVSSLQLPGAATEDRARNSRPPRIPGLERLNRTQGRAVRANHDP